MTDTTLDGFSKLSSFIFTVLGGGYLSQFTKERIKARDSN